MGSSLRRPLTAAPRARQAEPTVPRRAAPGTAVAIAVVASALGSACGEPRPTAIPPGPPGQIGVAMVPDPGRLEPLPWSLYFIQAEELVAWPSQGGALRVLAGPAGGDAASTSLGAGPVEAFGLSPDGGTLVYLVTGGSARGARLVRLDLGGGRPPETAPVAWPADSGRRRIEVALTSGGQSIAWTAPTAQGARVGLWQPDRDPTTLADCAPEAGPDAGCHDLMFSPNDHTFAYADGAGLHVVPVLRFGEYAAAPAPFAPDGWSGRGDLLLVRRGGSRDSPRGLLPVLPAGVLAQATRKAAPARQPTAARITMLDSRGDVPGEGQLYAWADDGRLVVAGPGPRPWVTLLDPDTMESEALPVPSDRGDGGATAAGPLWPAGVHGAGDDVLMALVSPSPGAASGVYRLAPGRPAELVAALPGATASSAGGWAAGDVWWSPDGAVFLAGRVASSGQAPTYEWLILGRTDTGAVWDASGVLNGAAGFRFGR